MKKNSLTTALLAGLAGAAGLATTAHAVNLNPDGLGQALIYPYYTVNGGNQTVLSIVNTSDDVKAVKVRFLESRNSREVLDFNLYLSPFDVWTAAVFDLNGSANLLTNDRSCTVPQINGNPTLPLVGTTRYVPFRNFAYTGSFNDGGGAGVDRTRSGHFEMIEMGVVQSGTTAGQLGDEATHTGAGVPANCARLVAAWSTNPPGVWAGVGPENAAGRTDQPTGGLFGSASLVDVAAGTMLAYNADAIDGFFFTGDPTSDLHFPPGNTLPTLNNARTGSLTPPVRSFVFNGGATSTIVDSLWGRGVDAVSAVFMTDAIYNEYTTDRTLGAATEWVITYPTKRFYVDHSAFGGPVSLPANPGAPSGTRLALPPFAGLGFTRSTTAGLSASFACEDVAFDVFDREEQTPFTPIGVDFSPPAEVPEEINSLCEEANVISFNQTGTATQILGATRFLNLTLPTGFVDGWMQVSYPANADTGRFPGYTSIDGDVYLGLPSTGFAAVQVVNANVTGGVLANYAGLFRHRGSRSIVTSGVN